MPSASTRITSWMPWTTTAVVPLSGSRLTVEMVLTTVSFCISKSRNWSMENSKNSHSTPMVMEKQKATMDINTGDRERENFSVRLSISTRANPMAAQRKPFRVWRMVSQLLKVV